MEDFDFNDTAPPPFKEQEFLMENLCIKKGRAPGGYEPPATCSSAKRWKHIHEQNMMTRLNEMHIIKKQNVQMSKEAAREIIRKIPVELLAKEWLSKEDATVDMRAYLVDYILPTLILGVERLLKEVDEKGLSATNRFEPEFNPINFLAQYLMRNNPRFSNFAEASPYVRGLREVSEEIKQELFTFEDNRLARIKAETRRKRTDRETHEQQIREEKERRHNQLVKQFKEWTDFTEKKSVEFSFLQNALRSFTETIEQLPAELQEAAKFSHPLEATDETGKTLLLKEFAEYVSLFVEDLPFEVFELFMDHMTKCAATQKASVDKENRRIILANLFLICDYGVIRFMIDDRKLNLLDRARIMTLFEQFWDRLIETKDPMGTVRNPRRWPVIEVEEVDDIMFDAWLQQPDGGIADSEIEKQIQLLEAIKSELHKELEVNAIRDKVAKEIWKNEQLEQKSAGYRAKLYKYNVTDFMNLIQYTLLDTMEAPLRYMDNTEERLINDHDLYESTLTRTARERSKILYSDSFELIKLTDEDNTSKDSKSTVETKDHQSSEISSKQDDQKPSEKATKGSKKAKDKNKNSRTQDFSSLEETSSMESINRNNNIPGSENNSSRSEKNSSSDNENSTSSNLKTKVKSTSSSKKRVKRIVRFSCASEESSEETHVILKPLKFRKPRTPLSSEDEMACQSSRFNSPLQQAMEKHGNIVARVGHPVYRIGNPAILPPIRLHKNVPLGQKIWNKQQIADGKRTEMDESIMLKDTQGETETANSEPVTGIAETAKNENETLEAEMANANVKEETVEHEDQTAEPETAAEAEREAELEMTAKSDIKAEMEITEKSETATEEITEKADTAAEEITEKAESAEEITEKAETAAEEITEKAETSAEEITGKADTAAETDRAAELEITEEAKTTTKTEITMGQKTEMPEEQSKEEETMNISSTNNQKDALLAEKKSDEKTKYGEDNKDFHESVEASKTLNTDTERRTDDTLIVHELAFDDAKDVDKTERELEASAETVKEELPVNEIAEEDIMKDLLASQTNLLQALIASGRTDRPQTSNIVALPSTTVDLLHLSTFSESYLNLAQFVQLVETFIGPHPDSKLFATLVHLITDRYQDHEPEKTDKLLEARQKAHVVKRKNMLNNLFEKWDNDGSGFMEIEAVSDVMCKFKEGQEVDAIRIAQSELRRLSIYHDNNLSKQEFRQFITLVTEELPGNETFDLFVEFLMNSVERSYAERIRGEARKKWIQEINTAAHTSGISMEPVYKAVFQALYKDADTHGGEKRISASIAMLEVNKLEPSRGELLLRYAACTPEDCQYMLGKPLYKNMKGVSFQTVETGKPVHVPSVNNHGNVYFWNYDRLPKERLGSFIVVPLKDRKKRVFGVLGVDTMTDSREETIFTGHEIQFFQGVAKAFSIAYHFVEMRRKFLRLLENAILWFHRRCPHIKEITVFFVEPSLRVSGDYVLRKIMVKDMKGIAVYVSEMVRLERKDNFFCKYLFDCMECSLTIVADVHESRHIACPIRDDNGITVCIIDLNSEGLKLLPRYESKDVQRLLRLLQQAHTELINMARGDEPVFILEAEKDFAIRTDLMFERIMLQELRDNISRLDSQSFAEIKGYYYPPRAVGETVRATIAMFKVDQVGEGEYDEWKDLKNNISFELVQNIKTYDPISAAHLGNAEKVEKYLKATFSVSISEVAEVGAIAAQQLYNWVHTCLTLIEYMCRMKEIDEE